MGAPAGPPMGAPAGPPMGASMGASAGAGSWTAYFTNLTYVGIPVSWFVVLIFAGVVPIAPMSFFGYAGANLMISGSPWWAVAKTGVQIASYLGGRLLTAYFPELWPISMILSYNPWYIFDIVQMFDPNFKLVGFRTPFFTTPLGTNIDLQKGTFGSITLIHIFVLILIFSLGGFTLLDVIPSEISGNYKNLIKTIFKVVAGVTGLIGGGLMAATAMPGMFGALKGGTMRGGGQMEGEKMEGGKMTIDDVAKSLMKPDNSSAFLFMGILLTAALGGIALSSARIE
jgi:hypothetical protein